MSRHRRREATRNSSGAGGLLNGLNLSDIINLLSKVDINRISSLINNVGNISNTSNENQSEIRSQDNIEESSTVKVKSTGEKHKDDAHADKSREEIVKAIKILLNADRALVVDVVTEIFGKENSK